jgi:hypothetical protein
VSDKIQRPDSTCGTWQEFRDEDHQRAWEDEHRELTGHGLDDEDPRRYQVSVIDIEPWARETGRLNRALVDGAGPE